MFCEHQETVGVWVPESGQRVESALLSWFIKPRAMPCTTGTVQIEFCLVSSPLPEASHLFSIVFCWYLFFSFLYPQITDSMVGVQRKLCWILFGCCDLWPHSGKHFASVLVGITFCLHMPVKNFLLQSIYPLWLCVCFSSACDQKSWVCFIAIDQDLWHPTWGFTLLTSLDLEQENSRSK